jgi:uncharacterized protein
MSVPILPSCGLRRGALAAWHTLGNANAGQYAQRAIGFERVRTQLNAMSAELDHEFWPDNVSIREARHIDLSKIHGHNQITDAYLLALAVSRGGALLTFDQRISLGAVPGATTDNLLVLQ